MARKTFSYSDAYAVPHDDVISVREEQKTDIRSREKLLDAVMGSERKRKSSEKIRRGRLPAEGFAFSALNSQNILIGTVRLWDIAAGQKNGKDLPALLLGPLAVHNSYKGRGVGSKLMRDVVQRAKEQNYGAILLVGDPSYYERFGFSTDKAQNLIMLKPYDKHRFQALEIQDGYLDGAQGLIKPTGRKKTAQV